jgi:hypothetical protein
MCLRGPSRVAAVDTAVDTAVADTVAAWAMRAQGGITAEVEWGIREEEEVAVSTAPVVLITGALPGQVIMGIHMVEAAAIIIMDPTPMAGAAAPTTGMEATPMAEGQGIAHAMLVAPVTITDTTIMAGTDVTEGIGTMVAGHIPQPSCMMLFGCHIQTLW